MLIEVLIISIELLIILACLFDVIIGSLSILNEIDVDKKVDMFSNNRSKPSPVTVDNFIQLFTFFFTVYSFF